jgi:predicted acylesterase/phospholipase RssA
MHATPFKLLLLLALITGWTSASAQEVPSDTVTAQTAATALARPTDQAVAQLRDVTPVVMTVSGGISKGSYQAGVNWGLIRYLKMVNAGRPLAPSEPKVLGDPRPYDIPLYTGASAGNINSVASAIEWCRSDFLKRKPEESLFWELWTPVGFAQLLPEHRRDEHPEALFSRSFFRKRSFESIRTFQEGGSNLLPGCEVALGITLTRLEPERVNVGAIQVETQRFVSIFRARVAKRDPVRVVFDQHGSTIPIDLSQLEDPKDREHFRRQDRSARYGLDPIRFGQLALPVLRSANDTANDLPNDTLIYRISQASSAFPVAFAPVELSYCIGRNPSNGDCTQVRRAEFIDGGVFDNNPLGLAYRMFEYIQYKTPFGHPPQFIYIDPDHLRTAVKPGVGVPTPARGMDAMKRFAFGAVSAGRQHELEILGRDLTGDQRKSLSLTDRSFPITGEHLGAFGAFLGRPFREYDFYVGIYDAFVYAARYLHPNCPPAGPAADAGCVSKILAGLYQVAELSPEAQLVFRELLKDEYGISLPEVRFRNEQSARRILLTALVQANREIRPTRPESANQRLLRFVRTFATPDVMRVVSDSAKACKRLRDQLPPLQQHLEDCLIDPGVEGLLRNPQSALLNLGDESLEQLARVEGAAEAGSKGLISLAQFAMRSYRMPQELGLHWPTTVPKYDVSKPSSKVPQKVVWWRRLGPHELDLNVSEGNIRIGYRPIYRFDRRFALTNPLAPIIAYGDEEHWYVQRSGIGVGVLHSLNGATLSAVEVGLLGTLRWSLQRLEPTAGPELAAYLFASKIRVGLQNFSLWGKEDWSAQPVALTLGLTDVSGMLYWWWRGRN